MRLIVARPEPDGARTAAALRARGHEPLVVPLLRMVVCRDTAFGSGPYRAVLMTSANAARAITGDPRLGAIAALPLFAVGRHTAEAARAIGFSDVRSADGDAGDVAALLRAAVPSGSVLYLAGRDRARDLAAELAPYRVTVRVAPVYRIEAAERFPADFLDTLAERMPDGAVHYSRRSAETFLRCARAAPRGEELLGLSHFCLSAAVAASLRAGGARSVRAAERPCEAALLELVGSG